ncbi:E3 UFM1-protein ligase 1 [Entomortierella beljakovae]|nr:E3 UFM1-protein ligase 1 [Entomortierella beljakovae]
MSSVIWNTLFGARDDPEDLKGPSKLSEEACGDLVQSLVRLGYLSSIAPSLDGNSFFTHEQLSKDISTLLEMRNGRVSLLDMPKALNANSTSIQYCVHDIIRSKPGTLLQVQDELLKIEYLDNMTTQMNKELSEQGFLVTADLCRKYKFGIDFMRQFLKDRVGNAISGQWDILDRGLIVSPQFLERQKEILIKALDDLEEPTSLQILRSRRIVQDQLFFGLCDILSKDNTVELTGYFRGANDQGFYVPHPYEKQQTEWIKTFFKDNGFIELDLIRKRGISDPKAYLQSNYPTAFMLDIYAVNESIWSIVDATIEDTIANLSWIDVKPLLPPPFTKDDISNLLRQLPCLVEPSSKIPIAPDQDHSLTGLGGGSPQEAFIIQDGIVVTSGQLQKCLLKMGPLLDQSLKALVSWRLTFGDSEPLDVDEDFNEDDDDFNAIGEHGVNLKGLMESILGNSQQKTGRSKSAASKNDIKKKKKGGKKQIQEFLTMLDLKGEIRRLEPEFDSALVNATAGALYKGLIHNLKDRNRSVILNQMQDEMEEEAEEIENKVCGDDSNQIRGVDRLPSAIISLAKRINAAVKNSLSKHILQSLCVEASDLIILHLAVLEKDDPVAEMPSESIDVRERVKEAYLEFCIQSSKEQGAFAISSDDAITLLAFAPQGVVDSIKKLRKLTAGSCKQKSLIEYIDILSALSDDSKIQLNSVKLLDNDENKILSDHLVELRHILTGIQPQTDPALMLHIVALIAFQKWTGSMLHASGKFVPRILRQLRLTVDQRPELKEMAGSQLDSLQNMMDLVLSNVKQQQQQSEGDEQDRDRKSQQSREQTWQEVYNTGVSLST